jgi:predicted transcriptional regulator
MKEVEMNDRVANHSLAGHIDSYQKLHFLLFLHQHPDMKGTCQEFGERLYFGHTPFVEEMINELNSAGLIERIENCYRLSSDPEVLSCLQYLAGAFESPLTRPQVLDRMRPRAPI